MKIFFCLVTLIISINSFAQITSSGIRGIITLDGNATENVTVKALHEPTGTSYFTTSQKSGNFTLPNLQSGGPYSIIITVVGYTVQKFTDVYLSLGNSYNLNVDLKISSVNLEEVTIATTIGKRKGTGNLGTNISKEQLERMPTLSRSLQDFIRLSPQSNGNSLAGANYRFNNLSVDGAALNDAFGFTESASGAGGSQATGSPGSLAKTQPISLEAVQQVQVEISPYNVTLGNFTGGSINAVTRSGTNKTNGSVFFSGRNQLLTGKSADKKRTSIENFHDYQTGFRIGGPLLKNKLFYFGAIEISRRNEPVPFQPGTEGAAIPLSVAQALYDTVLKRYGYDPGTFTDKILQIRSNKAFARIDWNINSINKLSLRHNYVQAFSDNLERNANVLNFGSQGYRHNSTTNSTVLELKSNFSNRFSNSLILGYTKTVDSRDIAGKFFPHIEITYNTANTIYLGAYREAAVYGLRLKTIEFTDNLTVYKNKHSFTAGTHNEFYNIDYRFLTAFNGRWAYRSADDFYANKPSRIRGVYNLQNNDYDYNRNNSSAKFRVILLSEYLQDEIALSKKLRIVLGLRLDHSLYPDREPVNAAVKATPGFTNFNNITSKKPQVAPRFGFNWDSKGDQQLVFRGGTGVFNGRMPFAWLAYPYYNNGNKYGNIDIRTAGIVPLQSNVAQVAATYQPGIKEINLLDNNFKLPQVWRSSFGVELKTKNNWGFTIEGVYTKTMRDVLFKTINLKDSTGKLQGTGDNRVVYLGSGNAQKVNSGFTNVFLLTNTSKGYRYQLSATISKKAENFNFTTSYTYGMSKDVSNGVRVSPQANWEFNQTILANAPVLAFSNFDLRHRSISYGQYTLKTKKSVTSFTAVFTAQSGTPYTYTYIGDINRDGSSNNDLVYIPRNFSESSLADIKNGSGVVITTAAVQWEQLNNYINNDKYLSKRRGSYAERNGARTPWNQQLDIKVVHTIMLDKNENKQSLSIALDVFNLSNTISKKWGRQYYVPNILNSSYQLLTVARANTATAPELNFSNPGTTPWQFDQLLSRTQGLLTLRYSF